MRRHFQAYDALGRVTGEVNFLNLARNFEYDAAGRLTEKIDRNDRITRFEYNVFDQVTVEEWYDGTTLVRTLSFDYDDAGQLLEASDPAATYENDYDDLGRLISQTQDIEDLSFDIVYISEYSAASSRTDLLAILGSTNDFHNTYAYDNLQRLTSLVQSSVSGGNAVAGKTVTFAYNANSQFAKISRYEDATGTEFVANTFYAYDNLSRLQSLIHTMDSTAPTSGWGTNPHSGYQYTFDAASRITSITSYIDGLSEYDYDHTSQLIVADHASQTDESYSYDENGNRTMSGYVTGDNNQLLSDGTHDYTYDNEGNRLTRTNISTGYVTEYTWDWRNRLIKVTEKDDQENVLSTVEFAYDTNDRRILKSVDPDGAGSAPAVDTIFSWENDQIALQFEDGDLTHRYLHGPVVDQVLADETVTSTSTPGTLIWPLADHLGTLSDLATHNSTTHATSIANHRTFDSFGNITAETNSAFDILFAFTGRERDDETGLQYHRARYYDPTTGRWIGEDPIGFSAGDSNLARYVANKIVNSIDPLGLQRRGVWGSQGGSASIGPDPHKPNYPRPDPPVYLPPGGPGMSGGWFVPDPHSPGQFMPLGPPRYFNQTPAIRDLSDEQKEQKRRHEEAKKWDKWIELGNQMQKAGADGLAALAGMCNGSNGLAG